MYTFVVYLLADDFKPKSVDSSQPGRLKVKGDEVSVFMPVLQVNCNNNLICTVFLN